MNRLRTAAVALAVVVVLLAARVLDGRGDSDGPGRRFALPVASDTVAVVKRDGAFVGVDRMGERMWSWKPGPGNEGLDVYTYCSSGCREVALVPVSLYLDQAEPSAVWVDDGEVQAQQGASSGLVKQRLVYLGPDGQRVVWNLNSAGSGDVRLDDAKGGSVEVPGIDLPPVVLPLRRSRGGVSIAIWTNGGSTESAVALLPLDHSGSAPPPTFHPIAADAMCAAADGGVVGLTKGTATIMDASGGAHTIGVATGDNFGCVSTSDRTFVASYTDTTSGSTTDLASLDASCHTSVSGRLLLAAGDSFLVGFDSELLRAVVISDSCQVLQTISGVEGVQIAGPSSFAFVNSEGEVRWIDGPTSN